MAFDLQLYNAVFLRSGGGRNSGLKELLETILFERAPRWPRPGAGDCRHAPAGFSGGRSVGWGPRPFNSVRDHVPGPRDLRLVHSGEGEIFDVVLRSAGY